MNIKISVVLTTHKRQLLDSCLHALLHQDFDSRKYEIIIIGDEKTEETKKVVDAYLLNENIKTRYIALNYSKGPAAARNLGWQYAKGSIIAFIDDDCIPDPLWLKKGKAAFTKNIAVVVGKVIVSTSKLSDSLFMTTNCFCRKEVLRKVDGFDERFSLALEDSEFHFKLLKNGYNVIRVCDAIVTHPVRFVRGISLLEQKRVMLRIRSAQRSFIHVLDMTVTSLVVPIFAVYWRLRGAIMYGVRFW